MSLQISPKHLNCPVPESSSRTVLKNAVSYVDQFDPKDLANGIVNLIHDEKIRNNLIKSGENLLNSIDKKKDYESLLDLIVKNRIIKERWNLF